MHRRSGPWPISRAASSPSPAARSTRAGCCCGPSMKQDGIDLKSEATIVYGAPPLLAAKTLSGEMDATLNYWNFCAALEAKGFRRLAGIEDLLPKLGAKGRTAMIGYVFDEAWAQCKPGRGGPLHRDDPRGEGDPGDLGCGVGEDRAADRRRRRRNVARLSRSLSRRHSAPTRSPTKKPTRAFSTACWRRSAAANLSGRRRNSIPAHSIARSPETEVLRLLSFAVFLATWWIASLLAGDAEAAAAARRARRRSLTEAKSGALFFNLGVTLARVALAFILAMTLGRRHRLPDGPGATCRPARRSLADPAAQPAGARRHRARLYLGRIDRGRRDRGDRHQQAADRRRHAARGNPRARRGARRNGDGVCDPALEGVPARHPAAAGALYRGRRAIRSCRWSGRSCWWPNCSDARTASASRSASPSSCSTSRSCSPIR